MFGLIIGGIAAVAEAAAAATGAIIATAGSVGSAIAATTAAVGTAVGTAATTAAASAGIAEAAAIGVAAGATTTTALNVGVLEASGKTISDVLDIQLNFFPRGQLAPCEMTVGELQENNRWQLDFWSNDQRLVTTVDIKGGINMELTFGKYTEDALRTRNLALTERDELISGALGLAGEAGEVCDIIKKHFAHGHELDRQEIANELGDVLWYLALICENLGLALSDVGLMNIAKLKWRYPEGFSSKDSISRVDVKK